MDEATSEFAPIVTSSLIFIDGKIVIRDIQFPRAYGVIVRTDGMTLEIEYVMRNEFYDEQE